MTQSGGSSYKMSLAIKEAFPHVSPVAVAVGAVYSHVSSFVVQTPLFQALYKKSQQIGASAESTAKSEEAASVAAAYGSSAVSSGLQSYAVAALLKLTGTTSYKGASIIGTLLFAVVSGPQIVSSFFVEKKPVDTVAAYGLVSLLNTVGLSLVLTWAEGGNPVLDEVKNLGR